jgi:hypothetical protein
MAFQASGIRTHVVITDTLSKRKDLWYVVNGLGQVTQFGNRFKQVVQETWQSI